MDLVPKPKPDQYYEYAPFRVPKYRITFQGAKRLSDVPGYVWYSPAALYLWGAFTEQNLADVVQQTQARFFWYHFERPIFTGLDLGSDVGWNHVLWAASESEWPKIRDLILEVVQISLETKQLCQYALQSLRILDPLAMDHKKLVTGTPPTVDIKVFAVLSNQWQYAVDLKRGFDPARVPRFSSFPPASLHTRAATRLFSLPNLTQEKAANRYKQLIVAGDKAKFEADKRASQEQFRRKRR